MSECTKCGAKFVGTPENPPVPGLCRCCQIEELTSENQRLQKDVNDLNNLLRHVGWGQGEIDSSASIVEDMEKLEKENQRLREQVSKLTGVPQGSPFQDEGCAFTFSDWMRTRQKALDERDQWRAVAQEQRNAFARISAWGAYAYHPKTASLFETAQALEANLAECQKEAVQQIAALDKLNTP